MARKNKFNIGELVIFPSYKPVNNKYYYVLIVDIIENERYLGKAYKCIMDGEIITLTKSTIGKI